ncbi:MAG TPA: hypothetical protein PKC95_08965, partial [Thauera aminoaromatica]|nr:hypothetical protein [Thauera aminoaromatica]
HATQQIAQAAARAASCAARRLSAENASEHVSDTARAHGVVEARTALLAHALLKDLAEDVSEVHGGLPFMM